jgi:hypothetical protein
MGLPLLIPFIYLAAQATVIITAPAKVAKLIETAKDGFKFLDKINQYSKEKTGLNEDDVVAYGFTLDGSNLPAGCEEYWGDYLLTDQERRVLLSYMNDTPIDLPQLQAWLKKCMAYSAERKKRMDGGKSK